MDKNIKEWKVINDRVIKKVLAKDTKEVKEYVASIISCVTKIPLEDLKDNLEPVYPEISKNANIVNSISDLVLKQDMIYFSIEINYGTKTTARTKKNTSYIFQLALRNIKTKGKTLDYNDMSRIIQINIDTYDYYNEGRLVYKTILMEEDLHKPYTKENLVEIYNVNLEFFKDIEYNEIVKNELLKLLSIITIDDEKLLDKLYKDDKMMNSIKKEVEDMVCNFDELLFYNEEELKKQEAKEIQENLRNEIKEEITNEIKQEITNEVIKNNSLEIAKNLLTMNLSVEQISKATKLSLEEIKKLQSEIK